jgi:AraC family transcriptional regulator
VEIEVLPSRTVPAPKILVSHSASGKAQPIVDRIEIRLSNPHALNDLVIEEQRIESSEVPSLFPRQHTVLLYLNRPPLRLERLVDGRFRRLDMMAGDICFAPLGSMTGLRWKGHLHALAVAPSEALVRRATLEFDDPDRIEFVRQNRVRDPQIEHIALALKADLENGCPSGRLYGESLGMALMVHLACRYSALAPTLPDPKGGMGEGRLRRTLEYIEDNLGSNLGLDELAANVCLSPHYFCILFRQSTGMTPHQWVLRRRVERAKQLLVEGRQSIVEVSAELGFADQSHLGTVFQRLVGTTPAAFLKAR